MKKLQQNNFRGLEIVLIIVLIAALVLVGYYTWHSRYTSRPIAVNIPATTGCSSLTKSVHVDASIVAEAKAAFIAKGFTGTWFDQHFKLVGSETHTDVLTDASTGWRPQNQVITVLSYRMCVGEYGVNVSYDHSDDDHSRSVVGLYAPAHDINSVISLKAAESKLVQCGGKLSGSGQVANSVVFTDIEDNGALYPRQIRLYLTANAPNSSNNTSSGVSVVQGDHGGITKSSQANVDLETGKCFITMTVVGI